MDEILLEQGNLRVTRCTLKPGETTGAKHRFDRLVIHLTDHEKTHVLRRDLNDEDDSGPKLNVYTRKVGDLAYLGESEHRVHNSGTTDIVTLIIEKMPEIKG